MSSILKDPPKYFRAAPPKTEINAQVDRDGGYRKAGIIRDVSLITEGEALGHGLWIDQAFLEQVEEAVNLSSAGVKSRFTHPSMSGDGLGRFVGRVRNATSLDGKVVADQHFSESGHVTPDGDLAGYLMTLAEEDPQAYGLSIVFDMDIESMSEFIDENSLDDDFVSPSMANKNNYPHARLKSLRAVDAVDEPAANPDGLFRRESEIVEQAEAVASFALGLSDDKPKSVALGLDADRVRGFVTRFLQEHELEIRPMSDQIDEKVEETAPVDEVAEVQAAESEPDTDTPEQGDDCTAPVAAKTGQDYLDTFGEVKGGLWFAQGKTWDEASAEYLSSLETENAELKQKLSAAASAGEDSPIEFRDDEEKQKRAGLSGKLNVRSS